MIKDSCNTTKFCAKCGEEIWSFERRENRNSGSVVHLRGQCSDRLNRPPGSDNPVVVDSIGLDNVKCFKLIGLLMILIMILLWVRG